MHQAFKTWMAVLCLLAGTMAARAATVTNFTPALGGVGDPVTVHGSGFFPGTLVLKFNGVTDPTAAATQPDVIQCHVPAGATTGPISVQINNGVPVMSLNDFTVIGPGPYITNFTPNVGDASSTVLIQGVHFISGQATNAYFNGRAAASFFVQSDIQIMTTPPAGVTTGPVSVRGRNGTNTTVAHFYVPPVITSITPVNGRAGTNVIIMGTNFTGALDVRFGGVFASSFTVLSNNAISVVVPANAVTGPVRVDAPAGSFTTTSNFTVRPTITGFTPSNGAPGTNVTIFGLNLTGTTSVMFGSLSVTPTGVTSTQLNAVVPANAVTAPITVTSTNGSDTSSALFYLPPKINSFSPSNTVAGTRVSIFGLNFSNATQVLFNGQNAASFIVTNNTSASAVVPAGVSTGPITIVTPGGSASSAGYFFAAPGITSFVPTHGLPGTNVVITGSNFLGVTVVKFNGVNASFAPPTNDVTLVATVPVNATTGPITVGSPGGTNTSAASFVLDYTSDLHVTVSVSPDPAFLGSNLIYTVTVTNAGPFAAPNVHVLDTLPFNADLVSAIPSQGTVVTNTSPIDASLGSLGKNEEATLTITVRPQSGIFLTNVVTASSGYSDPVLSDNTVTNVTIISSLPLLSISKVSSNRIRVSWPVALTNYTLQFKSSLVASNTWSNVLTAPIVAGAERVVTETNNSPARFYRLKQ